MKTFRLPFSAALLAIAVVLFTLPISAHADSYIVYNLGDADPFSIHGIDTTGAVVIFDALCGVPGNSCYTTYVNGVITNQSTTAPVLDYDNGTPCSVPPGFAFAGSSPGLGVCNNGYTGFGSRENPNGDPDGIYTGHPGSLSLVQAFGTTDQLVLNSSGDFAWVDGLDEEIYEAVDLTPAVPEPNTIVLLGSGLLSLAAVARRRILKT